MHLEVELIEFQCTEFLSMGTLIYSIYERPSLRDIAPGLRSSLIQ